MFPITLDICKTSHTSLTSLGLLAFVVDESVQHLSKSTGLFLLGLRKNPSVIEQCSKLVWIKLGSALGCPLLDDLCDVDGKREPHGFLLINRRNGA